MKTTELISLLSEQAREDIIAVGQWINPIPDEPKLLIEKITIAMNMVQYSHNRQASLSNRAANNPHLAALMRLKQEIAEKMAK